MRRRRPRSLAPEEAELWQRVAESAQPLHARRVAPPQRDPAATGESPPPAPAETAPVGAGPRFRIGERAETESPPHDTAPPLHEALAAQPVAMDRKAHARMTRGRMSPQARIDLHGMTLDQAHGALVGFISRAHADGTRLVLVITGKGRGAGDDDPVRRRPGVLRQQVPAWLRAPPIAGLVMQIAPAHRRHGGEGAYYVYLRRAR